MTDNIRYYMGRHKIEVLLQIFKKSYIKHLENGYTGNKTEGYKDVVIGEYDITLTRMCRRKKND